MLNEGTEPLPYEPYFEGLRSAPVTGVESVGANLLNVDGIDFENEIKTGAIHGKEVEAVYKENTQYCFTCRTTNKTEGLSGHILYLRVYYTDGTNNGYTPIANSTDNNALKKVVTEKGKTVQRIVFQYAVSATIAIDDAMLNEGSTALPYTPFVRNTLPIPAEVQALDGYGWGINADCYNYIDWEKKQFVKRVEKVVFKGSNDEQWKLGSYGDFIYTNTNIAKPIDAEKIYLISDRYEDVSFGDRINKSFPIAYVAPFDTTKNIAGLFFRNTGFTSVSAWQTHLAEQYASGKPVTVYYELAEPVITDISDLLPDDNLIGVEGVGTATMVNEYGYDVPSTIEFYLGNNKAVAADLFAGDLVGTASRAVCDEDGNSIRGTYAKYSEADGSLKAKASGQSPSVSCLRNSKFSADESEVPTVEGETVWHYK
jgi:hypothetical protein